MVLSILLITLCGRREERIDIITARMLHIQDTIPLQVTHISPIGSTEGYAESFKILIGFNQPMVALERIMRDAREGPLVLEPAIRGKYRWLGTRTLAFIPDDTIKPATQYKARLLKDRIASLTGMTLTTDTVWSFQSIRPSLITSLPYQGSQFVELNAYIYLHFNMEMSPDRIADKIKIYYTNGMPSKVWCADVRTESPRFRGEVKYSARRLRDEEKEDYPLRGWEARNTLVLEPRDRLPVESQIEVVLYQGLQAGEGNLGLDEESVIHFNTYNRFSLIKHNQTAPGEGALRLCFSNRVSISECINNIRIEPEIEIPVEYTEDDWQTTEMYLYLPFKPGQKYDVRLGRDLKDMYGNRIDKSYHFSFELGDFTPHVEIPTGINIIEAYGDRRLPVTQVNVDSVYLQAARIALDDAVPLLASRDFFYANKKHRPQYSPFYVVDRYWRTNARKRFRNQQMRFPIELGEVLGDARTGLVFLQLDHLGQTRYSQDRPYQKAFVEVSDIGVTWKYSPENNLIWTTSLSNTSPLRGIRVQIRNNENRILWTGTTDANGFCEGPGWAALGLGDRAASYEYVDDFEDYTYDYYNEPDLWLTLSGEPGVAVFANDWTFGIDPWRFNVPYDWYVEPEEFTAYIFTEKGLYRAGETVHIKGMVREKRRGQWVIPDARGVQIVVRDARGDAIMTDTLRLSRYASFYEEITMNPDAPTGVYSINARLLGKPVMFHETFRVEAYRPAEFEVKVAAAKDTFLAGERFEGSVEGRYLFGMPMKDAQVSWNLRRSYYEMQFAQHEGYQFGEYIEGRERDLLSSASSRLNERGECHVSARLSAEDIYAPSMLYLEGVVTAPNMTAIAGEQNWLALSAGFLLGLNTGKFLYVMGDTVGLDVITVLPSGSIVSGKNVRLEVFRTEWKSIRRHVWVAVMNGCQRRSRQRCTSRRSGVEPMPSMYESFQRRRDTTTFAPRQRTTGDD